MAYDTEQLKQGLMEDLAKAQETASQSANSRGAPEDSDFVPRSIRYKNKAVAQDELEASKAKIEEVIQHLSTEAGFVDQIQQAKFENDLRKRLNQFQLYMIRQAGQAEATMAQKKMDQKTKQAIIAGIGQIAGGLTEGYVSNMGKKGPAAGSLSNSNYESSPGLGVNTNMGYMPPGVTNSGALDLNILNRLDNGPTVGSPPSPGYKGTPGLGVSLRGDY